MEQLPYWIPILFFFIALFYSMVGFGGGFSYLAILVLAGLSFQGIQPTALVCNLIVTSGGSWHFYKGGHFKFKNVLPFIALSIPMAYLGGRVLISKELFCLLLGASLLTVALRLVFRDREFEQPKAVPWRIAWMVGVPIGGLLGFVAGLVGIGGGIFLSPLLLLMRWASIKEAAASASFFIFVNSLSGLIGQLEKAAVAFTILLPLALAVFSGGQIGSRLGSYQIPKIGLQRLLARLLLYVSGRLIWSVM